MNWKKMDRALSAIGTGMMGIGLLIPSAEHAVLLWYVAFFGVLLKCLGSGIAYLTEDDGAVDLSGIGKLIVVGGLVTVLAGCETRVAVGKTNDSLRKSSTAAAATYSNLLETFVKFYVSQEDAREDERYQAALASITRVVKVADGSTINAIDPRSQAALARQHERNLAQIQAVAGSMRQKILASGADAAHVVALSDALKTYFDTRTNVDQTINASAAEVLSLVQTYIPQIKAVPAATPAKPQALPSP